jgi:hypothetical protein
MERVSVTAGVTESLRKGADRAVLDCGFGEASAVGLRKLRRIGVYVDYVHVVVAAFRSHADNALLDMTLLDRIGRLARAV